MYSHATFALIAAWGMIPIACMASLSSINDSTWRAFNSSVSGRLRDGQPMLAPCYTNFNGHAQFPNHQQCSVLQSHRSDSDFVSDHFGGYQNVNWGSCQATGQFCAFGSLLNPDLVTPVTRQCSQGSVPSKYLEVHTVEDVQKGLAFAKEQNLKLVIKNTGHDFKGRSSAPDSFALWTHLYQPPITLQKSFTPEGCSSPVGDTISFGAGQQFQGIYEFAHAHNYRVVGGTSSSVGAAGGWITGGGHSMLSNELGLGVDNAQQLKVVLPNGTYVTANRCQNQDIFFALRGGGGGTFGVVMDMSTLVHEEKPMQLAQVSLASLNAASAKTFLSILVANADKWASEGWGGYISPGVLGSHISNLVLATSMLNHSDAEASMKPMLDFARQSDTIAQANVTTVDTFFGILKGFAAVAKLGQPSGSLAMSSRLVRRDSFVGDDNQRQLSSILNDILTSSQKNTLLSISPLFISVTAPTLYSKRLPRSDQPGGPGASSVTPAWRDTLWHVIHLRPYDGLVTQPRLVNQIWQSTHDALSALRDFTPGSGAYQNEADPFEPDPVGAFWGEENYRHLLQIKERVDPTNLLTVHQGVGWDRRDERYQCYPEVSI